MVKIYIVGAGPGSPEYVTPIARRIVQNACVVVGSERVLELFKSDIKGEVVVLTAKNFKQAVGYALECAKKGKNAALISTGDPCFAGLLRTVLKEFGEDLDLEVIPGISSVQACAARLRICWDNAALLSFHEGNEENKTVLLEVLKSGKTAIILPDPKNFTPKDIARFLISKGVDGEMQTFICENMMHIKGCCLAGDWKPMCHGYSSKRESPCGDIELQACQTNFL